MNRHNIAFGRAPIGERARVRVLVNGARRDLNRRAADYSPSERMAAIAFHAGTYLAALALCAVAWILG